MNAAYYPAIRAHMGDWTYFVSSISMRDAIEHFKFAYELMPFNDLDKLIQRELSRRTIQITQYLKTNDQRLFGSLIVAAYDGDPKFSPIEFETEPILRHLEGRIGVLTFDGKENYFVLDGQHRLSAMVNLQEQMPDSNALDDEISVVFVAHKRNDDGLRRTRRLFTNLNRYAAKTSKTVNIAIDEDDAYAILTRLALRELEYLQDITKVTKSSRLGLKSLATGESLHPSADRRFLFTITTLYECIKALLLDIAPKSFGEKQLRPTDTELEKGRKNLFERMESLFTEIDFLSHCKADSTELDLSNERSLDGGHVLARPIGLKSFTIAVSRALNNNVSWNKIASTCDKYSKIQRDPWVDLLWKRDGKMFFGKQRIDTAASLWTYLFDVPIDSVKVESDWLDFVDPDRTAEKSLKSLT